MSFMFSLFEWITHSSSVSLEEIRLIAIVNCVFHVSDFFRLLMMPFKYGLISPRYFLIDTILFLSPLISYLI